MCLCRASKGDVGREALNGRSRASARRKGKAAGSEANRRGFESYLEALRVGVPGHRVAEGVEEGWGFCSPSPSFFLSPPQARQQLGGGRPRVLGVEVSEGL